MNLTSSRLVRCLLLGGIFMCLGWNAEAGDMEGLHGDPIGRIAAFLAIILLAAKLGGDLAARIGQPSVLGELLVGVLLGNAALAGVDWFEPIKHDGTIDMLSRLGVVILLFEVGLESTVGQMLKVGLSSFLVAAVGVIAPFGLGWLAGAVLLPDSSPYVHAFIGATLSATSVGITARVLKDLNKSQTTEARIILGAAVIDDVMGLIILAVMTGSIAAADRGATMSAGQVGWTFAKAILFLGGALVIGLQVSPRMFKLASRLQTRGVLLAVALSWCFLLSWGANAIGLAPIVGAFAAGLILEDLHYRDFKEKGEHELETLIHPIASLLVPIFFVLMGMRTDLRAFTQPGVLTLAAVITAAAIIGKQVCAFAVVERGLDRLSIGLGMIPRGEVGLIFANIGLHMKIKGEAVIDQNTFSAAVIMVIVTTMVTPPLLKWSLHRRPEIESPSTQAENGDDSHG